MLTSQRAQTIRCLLAASVAVVATLVVTFVPIPMAVGDECTPTTTPDGVMIPCKDDGGGVS
jgi:hypothetical protein